MVAIVPGTPIPRATLSLVLSPWPPPLSSLVPKLLVGKATAIEVVPVDLCGDMVAVELWGEVEVVELTIKVSAAACADEELEELDDVEEKGDEDEDEEDEGEE